ncbi:MAG: hypothetical protein RBU25_02875 [Lentisphaeria bacterium]|jgi:hypothetical protein|nr:hypothetical protein [Lentisphaeria bacterium]
MAAYAKDSRRSARPGGRENQEGAIRASREGGPLTSWLIALFVLGTGGVLVFGAWEEMGGQPLLWLLLVYPFAGVLLAVRAMTVTIRLFRYGRPVLCLKSVPCPLGGAISGVIEFPGLRLPPFQSAELELHERHLLHRNPGRNSRKDQMETVWKVRVPIQLPPGGNRLAVTLPVPGDGKPTEPTGDDRVAWRILLRAATEGVNLGAAFDVPVSAGPGGDPGQTKATIEAAALRQYLAEGEKALMVRLDRERLTLRRYPAGLELRVLPLGLRRIGFGIASLFLLCLPLGYWVTVLQLQQSLGRWLGFAVLATAAALVSIPTMTKFFRVQAGRNDLRVVRHIFGIRRVWQIPYESIESIQPHSNMSGSDANGTVNYYDLKIVWRAGDTNRTVRLGLGITDKALATALAHTLNQPGEKPQ